MATDKTKGVQVRLSVATLDYLNNVIKDTQAKNMSEAIRLIVTERMIKDKENGTIRPFEYIPAPTVRTRKKERSREINTDEITSFPLGEAPPVGAPLTPSANAGNKTTKYFEKAKKPPYPGTMEEYIEAIKRGRIGRDQFSPPVE